MMNIGDCRRALVLSMLPMLLWSNNSVSAKALSTTSSQARAGRAAAAAMQKMQDNQAADALERQALNLFQQGKNAEAVKLLSSQLNKKAIAAEDGDLYYLLALIESQSGDDKSVVKDLQAALQAEQAKPKPGLRSQVVLLKRIGDGYYKLRDLKSALTQYQAALQMAKTLPETDPVKSMLTAAITGCFLRQDNLSMAENYAKKSLEIDSLRAQSGTFVDFGKFFWSQLQLLDIYKREGKDAERLALRKPLLEQFEQLLSVRAQLDAAGKLPNLDQIKSEFLTTYMKDNPPQNVADYLWLALNWRQFSLPLIRWQPDDAVAPKAAILCIHGLGLENKFFYHFWQGDGQARISCICP